MPKNSADPQRLSEAQRRMLERIREKGPYAWCAGSRAGGATARMAQRLVSDGLLSGPPYNITEAGRRALEEPQNG